MIVWQRFRPSSYVKIYSVWNLTKERLFFCVHLFEIFVCGDLLVLTNSIRLTRCRVRSILGVKMCLESFQLSCIYSVRKTDLTYAYFVVFRVVPWTFPVHFVSGPNRRGGEGWMDVQNWPLFPKTSCGCRDMIGFDSTMGYGGPGPPTLPSPALKKKEG